jgi:S-adenosylmethionine:tRNA ribosyltransferase-isomerase
MTGLPPLARIPAFKLPDGFAATEPPEARGLARDEVRLLVAQGGHLHHAQFRDLSAFLDPGDLVVVNTSATIPAALGGRRQDGAEVTVHVSGPLSGRNWIVELRQPHGGRVTDGRTGEVITLAGGAGARLGSAYPDRSVVRGSRLWQATFDRDDLPAHLAAVGRPIAYEYVDRQWPLSAYQTIFAHHPGSAEMPSAGRPFSAAVLTDLVQHGIAVAPLTLHTGVSSLEAGETPLPERYRVPSSTARLVNATRAGGGRIVAAGTTVTRALETAAAADGTVSGGAGWTDLVIGPDRPVRVVDSLVTGWHEPDASHLVLLAAVAGHEVVAAAYDAAIAVRYRWHEFGDSCLLLSDR